MTHPPMEELAEKVIKAAPYVGPLNKWAILPILTETVSRLLAAEDILAQFDTALATIESLREQIAPMECGHPKACLAASSDASAVYSKQPKYCKWCEDIAKLNVTQERRLGPSPCGVPHHRRVDWVEGHVEGLENDGTLIPEVVDHCSTCRAIQQSARSRQGEIEKALSILINAKQWGAALGAIAEDYPWLVEAIQQARLEEANEWKAHVEKSDDPFLMGWAIQRIAELEHRA